MRRGFRLGMIASYITAAAGEAVVEVPLFVPKIVNANTLRNLVLTLDTSTVLLRVPKIANVQTMRALALAEQPPTQLFVPKIVNVQSMKSLVLGDNSIWQTAFSPTSVSATSSTATGTWRNVIPASVIMAGSKVRLTFRGNTTIGRAFIGEQAASGDAWDFASAPTQITFDGGSPGATIGTGIDKLSDEVNFVQDGTKNMVISIEKTGGSQLRNNDLTGAARYQRTDTSSDGDTVDASGYGTLVNNSTRIVVKMEVYGPP